MVRLWRRLGIVRTEGMRKALHCHTAQQHRRAGMRGEAFCLSVCDDFDAAIRQRQNRMGADKGCGNDMVPAIQSRDILCEAGLSLCRHARQASTAASISWRLSLRPIKTILD